MQNQVVQMMTNYLQNQLKIKSPQVLQNFEAMRQNNSNPMEILNQITGGFSKEQMQGFMTFAKNFGIPNDMLSQIQNGINLKG